MITAQNTLKTQLYKLKTYFTVDSSNLFSKLTDCGVIGGADEFKGVLDVTNGGEPSEGTTDTA